MNARTLATLAVLLCFPVALAAQVDADARLNDDVARALRSYARLTIFDDVTSQAQAGVVTLSGKVTMPFKKTEVGKRIGLLAGVDEVRNEIDVLPVSIEDEELRKRVARAIYGNPAFYRYAAMAHPPIHIVVEDGRVTLTGVVPSGVDRALARSLADGQGARRVTCALRTESETRESQAGVGSSSSRPRLIVHQIRSVSTMTAARNAPPNSQSVR